MHSYDAALRASLYWRKPPSLPEILASLGLNARGWWTVYDPSLPSNPGITLSSGNVQSWQDQLYGFVLSALSAGTRPSYAVDGTHFGGLPVVQTATSSTRILQGSFGSTWLATGERLAIFTVMRLRTLANVVFLYEVSDGTNDRGIWYYTDTSNNSFSMGPNGGVIVLAGELDVTQHTTLVHMRTTGNKRVELQPEGVSTLFASTAGLNGALSTVTLGARRTPSGPGDWSIAEVVACRDLSDDQAASIMAALRAKWELPLQTPPSSPYAIDYWHSVYNTSSANTTGQIARHVLIGQGGGVPNGIDSGFFKNRSVMQPDATKFYSGPSGDPTITAAGTRPYLYAVARLRSLTGAVQRVASIGQHFGTDRVTIECSASGVFRANFAGVTLDGPAADTNVHRFEAWVDGVNRNFRVDGVLFSAADTSTIGLCNQVGLGAGASVGANPGNVNLPFCEVFSQYPGDPHVASLNAWTKQYWGAP